MSGQVVMLAGSKGSPGTTWSCIRLAGQLAQMGCRCVLLDADVRGGEVGPYLNHEGGGMDRLARALQTTPVDRIHPEAVSVPTRLGFRLITNGLHAGQLGPIDLDSLVAVWRSSGSVVIVDAGSDPGPEFTSLSRTADRLIWIVVPTAIGLRRFAWSQTHASLDQSRACIVLNQVGLGSLVGAAEGLARDYGLLSLASLPRIGRGPGRRGRLRRALDLLAETLEPGAVRAKRSMWRPRLLRALDHD